MKAPRAGLLHPGLHLSSNKKVKFGFLRTASIYTDSMTLRDTQRSPCDSHQKSQQALFSSGFGFYHGLTPSHKNVSHKLAYRLS